MATVSPTRPPEPSPPGLPFLDGRPKKLLIGGECTVRRLQDERLGPRDGTARAGRAPERQVGVDRHRL